MLDLTFMQMVQNRNELIERNKRAMKYSEKCTERNKAKLERIADRVVHGFIIIISCAITYLMAR